jgi:hypothetical protein
MTDPIPWSEETPPSWGEALQALPWAEDREGPRLRGWSLVAACPTCGHDGAIDIYFAHSIITGFRNARLTRLLRKRIEEQEARPTLVERPVECDCGSPHPGRPADRVGCGRSADVKFTVGG